MIPDQTLSRHLEQIGPMTAGLYIQVTTGVGPAADPVAGSRRAGRLGGRRDGGRRPAAAPARRLTLGAWRLALGGWRLGTGGMP